MLTLSTTTYQVLNYFGKNILELEVILIAITSLFVYILYNTAKDNLKQEINKIAKKEAEKMKEEAIQRIVMGFATTWKEIAFHTWRKHKKRDLVPTKDEKKKIDEDYLQGMTIDSLRDILKFTEEMLPYSKHRDFWEKEQNKRTFLLFKNNLSWFIAWKKDPSQEEKKEALVLAKELYDEVKSQKIPNYHFLDTIAWVFRRFPLTDKDKKESERIVNELKQRKDIPQTEKKYLLYKYNLKSGQAHQLHQKQK